MWVVMYHRVSLPLELKRTLGLGGGTTMGGRVGMRLLGWGRAILGTIAHRAQVPLFISTHGQGPPTICDPHFQRSEAPRISNRAGNGRQL